MRKKDTKDDSISKSASEDEADNKEELIPASVDDVLEEVVEEEKIIPEPEIAEEHAKSPSSSSSSSSDNEGDQDDENKDQDIANASEVNVIDEEVEKTSLKKGDSSSSSSSSEDEDKDEEPKEDAPSEAVDPPPPTTYAKLITPSGFSAPSSSEYNA